MAKAVFHKNGRGLWAQCDEAAGVLKAIKDGRDVMVTVKTARNPAQHRLFFAMLNKVVKSGDWAYGAEQLLHWLKLKNGWFDRVEVNGKAYIHPRSISFESMEQTQFKDFFDRSVFHLCNEICGDGLRDEINAMLDQGYSDMERGVHRAAA